MSLNFQPRHFVTLALIVGIAGTAAFMAFAQGSYAAAF